MTSENAEHVRGKPGREIFVNLKSLFLCFPHSITWLAGACTIYCREKDCDAKDAE